MTTRVVIFDFDGTIADAIPIFREVYEEIATKRGLPHLDEQTYLELRKGNVKDFVKWVGIKSWRLPSIMNEGRKIFASKASEVKLFDGIPEVITQLHQEGSKIYVLSSNSEATIQKILKLHGIDGYITILKRPPIFGKAQSIKKLIKKNKYDKSGVWMVGDELRDVEAGKSAGVRTVSVTWGLQDSSTLESRKPDYLVDNVQGLKQVFQIV